MLGFGLVIGMAVGIWAGGWRSLQLARRLEVTEAERALRRAGLWAAGTGVLSTALLTGWPMKQVQVSVPTEVTQTIWETVEVPVRVWRWFVWPATQMEQRKKAKEVVVVELRERTHRELSLGLCLALLAVGAVCYAAEHAVVRLCWSWGGLSGT